ncbi:MAG: redoxin domain-containing protein [Niastella sp.]|nr:redoxin domain-containing protein [Niastella sp.]
MIKIFTLTAVSFLAINGFAQGYQINVQTPYPSAGIAYLTYHFGKNLNVQDSVAIDERGVAHFDGKEALPGGIYAFVFPGKRNSFDFLIDKEQKINIVADTANLDKIKITGSKEDELFQQYRHFVDGVGRQLSDERVAYMSSKTAKDSTTHEMRYMQLNKELNDYRESMITKNPESMMAVLLNAMKESPYLKKTPVTHKDSVEAYNYYKANYWTGINFMDGRIIRTPFFIPKLERYYREVMPQSPDSLIKDIDYRLLYARNDSNMYKLLLNWFTDEYINPRYMGQDAVFLHLFDKYHSKGLTPWLSEKQMETITKRAYMLMANQLGEPAANMQLLNRNDKPASLYDVKADYTIVLFWDPNCSHCKHEIPIIDSVYKADWQKHNIKIYAVLTEYDKKAWTDYIDEHKINDWVNVHQTKEMADAEVAAQRPGYKQLYDVIMTPTLFLLDKDKRIVAKKLTWEQINDLLKVKFAKTAEK